MSTKSHWRQAGLLSGLVATLGPVPASLMSTAPGGKKRPSRHYLRRITNEMLARGWRPKPAWRGDR